ncbi:MAG: hypothetical protein GY841_15555 [FCB group bacterium]|nr:hypothetical protein [FCB group bacterium]
MKFNEFYDASKKFIDPRIRVKYKEESKFWKLFPLKMRSYWTTLGKTIWAPNRERVLSPNRVASAVAVYLHECRHVADSLDRPIMYYIDYCFPQILAPFLAIAAVVLHLVFDIPWHLGWSLGASCIALFPWPSSTRLNIEDHAYAISTWIRFRRYKNFDDPKLIAEATESLSKVINSWVYYKMTWRNKTADIEAKEIIIKAVGWCREERHGLFYPDPFENADLNGTLVKLLDEPFSTTWYPRSIRDLHGLFYPDPFENADLNGTLVKLLDEPFSTTWYPRSIRDLDPAIPADVARVVGGYMLAIDEQDEKPTIEAKGFGVSVNTARRGINFKKGSKK